jgi:hypothetical protein
MIYISECCSAEALEHSLQQWVHYESSKVSLERKPVWYGRCSSCYDQAIFNEEES